jgi:hypothetical protein
VFDFNKLRAIELYRGMQRYRFLKVKRVCQYRLIKSKVILNKFSYPFSRVAFPAISDSFQRLVSLLINSTLKSIIYTAALILCVWDRTNTNSVNPRFTEHVMMIKCLTVAVETCLPVTFEENRRQANYIYIMLLMAFRSSSFNGRKISGAKSCPCR